MPAAYSTDIRGRVIASVESGSSRREVAEEFDVSASSAIKWVATYRTTGSCAAKPRGGSTSPLEKYANFLLTLIEGQPDLTLDEVVCVMRKHKNSRQSHRGVAFLSAPQDHVQKNDLGRRRPCGRRNVGALSCTWKGAAECFLVAGDPVKKHGPWAVAGLKVATPSGDPVLGN